MISGSLRELMSQAAGNAAAVPDLHLGCVTHVQAVSEVRPRHRN